MKSAEEILAAESTVKLHARTKVLPKMSISNVDLPDDEVRDSILSKNPQISNLVNNGFKLELLFVHNVKNSSIRNAIIKVDPAIRNLIVENKYKIFVGMKNCTVYDRIHYKTCYNCQKIGAHTSKDCPTSDPICRFCAGSHRSADCESKNDPSTHQCANCLNSDNDSHKSVAKSHMSNASTCPLVINLSNNIMLNTEYKTSESKNVYLPLRQMSLGATGCL